MVTVKMASVWTAAAAVVISSAGLAALGGWGQPPKKEGPARNAEPPKKEAVKDADKKDQPKGEDSHKASQAPSAAMDAIKKLAGTWEGTEAMPDGSKGSLVFKVTSGNSVVLETMMPGTEHEMTNAYHMDGKDLVFTHYCAAGNQPRLKAKDPQAAKTIVFEFKDGTNMDPKVSGHMGSMTLTIVDDTHLKEEWRYFKDGKTAGEPMVFEFVKKTKG